MAIWEGIGSGMEFKKISKICAGNFAHAKFKRLNVLSLRTAF